jgi:hypothetical protein
LHILENFDCKFREKQEIPSPNKPKLAKVAVRKMIFEFQGLD